MDNFGGIEFKNIVIFQTQIMMGAQYRKLQEAQKKESCDDACKLLVQTCLRLAWNDAFRHVTKNQDDYEQKIKDSKHKTFDEYVYNIILSNDIVVNTFKEYIKAKTTEDKVNVLRNAIQERELAKVFETIKIIDSNQTDKALCFGHFQKLYNMAVKLYICLYILRKELDLAFMEQSVLYADPDCFNNADCPIDSYILKKLDVKCKDSQKKLNDNFGKKRFKEIVWSKLKDEDKDIELYKFLQSTIRDFLNSENNFKGKCNLYFDFAFWK